MRVVDKATGEYIELDYTDQADFGVKWDEVTQRIAALERLKKKMAAEALTMLGNEDALDLGNGMTIKRIRQERKSYNPLKVIQLFGDDAAPYIKIDKTKLDAELKEHADDGGRWISISQDLRNALEVDSVVVFPKLFKS
jgi:hypothetical protein